MNIQHVTIEDIPVIWELWNREVEEKYQLQDRLMKQIYECEDFDMDASFVAIDNNKIIGAILVKRWQRDILDAYQKHAWISLFVVDHDYQRQGIGTKLLSRSIKYLQGQGYQTLHVGKGMNPLFCGIPSHWDSPEFFVKHGFSTPGMTYDMHAKDPKEMELRRKLDYEVRLATIKDEDAINAFFTRSFPGRWQEEYREYVRQGGSGEAFAIMLYDQEVIAFCRINHPTKSQPMYNTNFSHNFTSLYGVGPLGVDDRYRKLSLGYDITAFAVNQAVAQGATDIIIDWTSHVEFYKKFGCQVWQEYVVLDYQL